MMTAFPNRMIDDDNVEMIDMANGHLFIVPINTLPKGLQNIVLYQKDSLHIIQQKIER